MPPIGFAGIWRGRMHYAWIALAVMFSATLAGVGVRAAPGVMIVPLQRAFGWDVATVSGAISLNIILLGATGPFLTGLIEVIGLKRTILACMAMLIAGTGLSNLMTAPWQMFLTWGLMVGIGSGEMPAWARHSHGWRGARASEDRPGQSGLQLHPAGLAQRANRARVTGTRIKRSPETSKTAGCCADQPENGRSSSAR
jgi:MFS family permease